MKRHEFLLRIPERLWKEIVLLSQRKSISITDTILILIDNGMQLEKLIKEEIWKEKI